MEDNKKAVKMKSETQVLRTFTDVGGFGRTWLNKNARGTNIEGGIEINNHFLFLYMHFFPHVTV